MNRGDLRSFQEAANHTSESDFDFVGIDIQKEGGFIEIDVGRRRCPVCGVVTFKNQCERCKSHTYLSLFVRNVNGKPITNVVQDVMFRRLVSSE